MGTSCALSYCATAGFDSPAKITPSILRARKSSIKSSWTASSCATDYIVLRGTQSGGPYSPIATPTGTSFTDTGPANGTTYFYITQRFFIDATLEFP